MIHISPAEFGDYREHQSPDGTRPAFCLVREQAAAASRPLRRLAAPAVVAMGADSARGSSDHRGHLFLPAGARTMDAAARAAFVGAGRAVSARAARPPARLDRTQMDRASARKGRALTRPNDSNDSGFRRTPSVV